MFKRLAIIGASMGQIEICKKAKKIPDLETYCFAWDKGAVCKDLVDYFIPISTQVQHRTAIPSTGVA